jgi:molybdopterin converting factor subunit 1
LKIKVKYFASIKEWTGLKEETLEVPDGSTANDLRKIVLRFHDKLEMEGNILIAVNGSFVDLDRILNPNDEVALFPPVSGG